MRLCSIPEALLKVSRTLMPSVSDVTQASLKAATLPGATDDASDNDGGDGGLSKGAIAGIVIGSVAGAALLAAAACVFPSPA